LTKVNGLGCFAARAAFAVARARDCPGYLNAGRDGEERIAGLDGWR
jgi:hypothetical protein